MPRRPLALVLAAVALLGSACSPGEEGPGPLGGLDERGTSVLTGPDGVSPWTATFGGFVLCSRDEPVRVVAARVRSDVPARSARALVHVTGPQGLANGALSTLGAVRGSPPYFEEPWATYAPTGAFYEPPGTLVDSPCSQRVVTTTTELLVSMEVGPSGGRVRDVELDYVVGDTTYTTRLRWRFVACGTATPDSRCH